MIQTLNSKQRELWIAISRISAQNIAPLLLLHGDPEWLEEAFFRKDPELTGKLTESEWNQMIRTHDPAGLDAILRRMNGDGIRTLTVCDPDYPDRLRQISDPPLILFYQGSLSAPKSRTMAMIGSRRASSFGLRIAEATAEGLSKAGVTIASGLAYGIDSSSHQGCLKGSAPTIAVLGCGLDILYPSGNERLKSRILDQGGLFLSEYPPGDKPLAHHFPVRNRIISGISQGVILIEARIQSGSMRTIDHALNQGREIFVYPGNPESECFTLNHTLLRDGARIFFSPREILEDMGWLDNSGIVGQNIEGSDLPDKLSDAERKIFQALRSGPAGFDQLAAETGLEASDLLGKLTMMQIRGLVEPLPGKCYGLKKG
ncbi:MAG: DNA-processing protein DprA [Clostridia bacterium]|nr:DNA-processing protein DprA [Clostridia bacterium]